MIEELEIVRQNYELHFAPLQGFTDCIFRNAFEKYFGGVKVYYTPFIRIEKGGFRNKDLKDIDPCRNTVPKLIPQILPGSAEETRLLTDMLVEKGYSSADINLGCPFPLIAGKQKGAGMLPYPEKVEEVLQPLKEYPEVQFSVKMRLGWENVRECLDVVGLFNELRLHHITVHARTGKQQYKGTTQPEAFSHFYQACKHPVFYNGDLSTVEDIGHILQKFPRLRGVSLGRGLLSSPFVVADFYQNENFSENLRMSLFFKFHEELFSGYAEVLQGENQLLMKMKTLWEYFLSSADPKLLKRIRKANKLSQYNESVQNLFRN